MNGPELATTLMQVVDRQDVILPARRCQKTVMFKNLKKHVHTLYVSSFLKIETLHIPNVLWLGLATLIRLVSQNLIEKAN